MHICLPDTREVKPQHGSAYLLYNVHIDGLYHCSLRYKQLLHLHQALLKKFTTHQLSQFPPKKLLPLSVNQVEERRQQLEKYLQNISQDKAISNSSLFNLFLLEAQRESTRIRQDRAHLDIELVNGQKIRLQVFTHDSADAILTAVCRALGLNDRYHAYFCLCLCGYDVIRDKLIIKRRLSFFESPYVTLQMAVQQQEQLHSVLTAAATSTATTNTNQCDCYLTATSSTTTASTSSNQSRQLTAAAAAVINNNCQCMSCLNNQQSNLITTTNDVPPVGSSSGSSTGNNNINNVHSRLCHYNKNSNICSNNYQEYQQQHTSSSYPHCTNQHQHQTINPSTSVAAATTTTSALAKATVSTSSFVTHRILLRKSYWDPVYDTYILNDQQALNLLFIQTVYDIKHSLMFVDRETYHKLESLLASDSKLEYILLARTLKYYNYVHFEPCLSDYPRPKTKVMISIGSKELNMRVLKSPKSVTKSNSNGVVTRTTTNSNDASDCSPFLVPCSSSAASSSPSSASSSSSTCSDVLSSSSFSSSSSTTASSNITTNHHQAATNQQVKEPSDQVLYCTSSMVPSGYRHLITKDDLVEEEYNFKVPLIRCWRLTSLETLNSNNINNTNDFPSGVASNARRKTLSLFNSLSIGSSSSNNNNSNTNSNSQQSSETSGHQQTRGALIDSGNGGTSLLAALVGGSNGFHRSSLPQQTNGRNQTNGCSARNYRCSDTGAAQSFSQYELSFEYLVSKDTLRWITILSDQAIFISISLQGVVDELVSKRDGNSSLYQSPTQSHVDPAASLQMMQAARQNPNHNANSNHQQSFTYMYRDGRQKALNTSNQQLIDQFGTTLGYSPINPSILALARQRQQSLRAANTSNFLGSTGSRFTFLGYSPAPDTTNGNHHSSLEISHLKKAPSPIINDAFEGVTNDDDL